jgi:hypothetical protein
MSDHSTVRKGMRQNAKVGEALAVATRAAYPALVGARFALILAVLSFLLSAVAIGVAVSK